MKTASAQIQAGICGFSTSVRAEGDDDFTVRFTVTSDCEKVRAFAAELDVVSTLDELGRGHEGTILSLGRQHMKGCCAACVVPPGIFKAMQVAGGLALAADVAIGLHPEE